MAERLARVMAFQYKEALTADHPNIIPLMCEKNIKKWHFLITNLPGAFEGGEYIFRLTAPEDFPHRPPEFEFLTENGVFKPGGKVCISIGEFHADDPAGKTGAYGWRKSLGMIGFAREVVNGMVNDPDSLGGGIRILNETPEKKASLAAQSIAFNEKELAPLVAQFRAFEEAYPGQRVVKLRRMWRAATTFIETDLRTVELDSLPPLFAAAFGDEDWGELPASLSYLIGIPDIPAEQLAPMGFVANGRTILLRIAGPLRAMFAEREPSVRRVLALALHARIQWEIARGESGNYAQVEAAAPLVLESQHRAFVKGFKAFLEALPGVCGGASRKSVPDAMRAISGAPDAFLEVYDDLVRFLCTQHIDQKAGLGKSFAAQVQARAATTPAYSPSMGATAGGDGASSLAGMAQLNPPEADVPATTVGAGSACIEDTPPADA